MRATYYTRSGAPYEGLTHIADVLNFENDRYLFDGELTLLDKSGLSDNEAFRVVTGIINSDTPYKTQICYTIFDVVQTEEFGNGDSNSSYREHRKVLDPMTEIRPRLILPALYSGPTSPQSTSFWSR